MAQFVDFSFDSRTYLCCIFNYRLLKTEKKYLMHIQGEPIRVMNISFFPNCSPQHTLIYNVSFSSFQELRRSYEMSKFSGIFCCQWSCHPWHSLSKHLFPVSMLPCCCRGFESPTHRDRVAHIYVSKLGNRCLMLVICPVSNHYLTQC